MRSLHRHRVLLYPSKGRLNWWSDGDVRSCRDDLRWWIPPLSFKCNSKETRHLLMWARPSLFPFFPLHLLLLYFSLYPPTTIQARCLGVFIRPLLLTKSVSAFMCSRVLTSLDPLDLKLENDSPPPVLSHFSWIFLPLCHPGYTRPLAFCCSSTSDWTWHFGKVASFGSLFLTLPHSLPAPHQPSLLSLSVISLLSISFFSSLSHLALSLPPSVPPSFLLSLFLSVSSFPLFLISSPPSLPGQ